MLFFENQAEISSRIKQKSLLDTTEIAPLVSKVFTGVCSLGRAGYVEAAVGLRRPTVPLMAPESFGKNSVGVVRDRSQLLSSNLSR